ncbi:MAG: purine-binding chemotaxis protein CheW [Deltaproteobacteria bacterium]|nr:purine-binding chemotaxis protein CheW [Deltaproteobacteria bacterium]
MERRTIDWEAIHRRLALAAAAIAGGLRHGPEETRRVLEARARVAAKPALTADDGERIEILAFTLAGEAYGVETRHVREVCQLKDLTALPCTPPFVAGVMSLRGQVLAVIDLRQFFELPAKGLTELNRVVVLKGGDNEMGLLADSIDGVRSVAAADLQQGLPTLTGIRERFLKGITGQMLAILDGGRLLADAGLRVNEHATR